MKILFVLENYYPNIGGVETLFKSLAESLAALGHEVTVFTNKFSDNLQDEETINEVRIVRVPYKNRYLFTFLSIRKLLPYARRADLIHTTSYNAGLPSYLAGKLTRTKTIITFHEVWGNLWYRLPYMNRVSSLLHYSFEWFLLKLRFTKFVAVSEFTKKQLVDHGVQHHRVSMIYNGINYKEYSSAAKSDSNNIFTFTYFGRLGISKGLDLIVPAIQALKEEKYSFRFNLIIPKEPQAFHNRIKNAIVEKGLSEAVKIRSHLDFAELQSVISQSDCVVIPSYSEGFCYSAVETMALSIPIISSGKGALSEVVSGRHITMKEQSIEGLSGAMKLAISGQWDYKLEKKYLLSDSVNAYITCYNQIIKGDG